MKHHQPDSVGYVPMQNIHVVGQLFRHTKTGLIYKVTGFVWFGDMDRWLITHEHAGETFARTPESLNGRLLDGRKRVVWL